MARNLGDPVGLSGAGTAGVTPAVRATRPGWRDPRLWVGIAIVAASVVVGARVLASADNTVQVWAAASDMGAGDRLTEEDLVVSRVRFADGQALAGYFTVDAQLPADLQLTRGIAAGELLPRAAVGSTTETGLLELPIAVEPEQVPPSVDAGAVVDVYLVGAPAAAEDGRRDPTAELSGPVLIAVTVLDAPRLAESFGTTGRRQLVLAVPEADAERYFEALAGYDAPVLTVVRRG